MDANMQNWQISGIDKVRRGEWTIEHFHVQRVLAQRVFLVSGTIPRDARCHLNAAVKRGELKHIKKDGLKPECYYNPAFEYLVSGKRNAVAEAAISAIRKVFC